MYSRIKDLDEVSVYLDAVGNIDRLLERLSEGFGDGGFAVSARTVQEDWFAWFC